MTISTVNGNKKKPNSNKLLLLEFGFFKLEFIYLTSTSSLLLNFEIEIVITLVNPPN
jgi:hypothetical protein